MVVPCYLLFVLGTAAPVEPASGPATCVVDGVIYLASDGTVYGCEGGGSWCGGAPVRPGVCDAPREVVPVATGRAATCVVDGIEYLAADGSVYACEGGGNWCHGAPPRPGVCAKPPAPKEVPAALLGAWLYAGGMCRGSSFTVHADKVEYLASLEPLGTGRILGVTPFGQGWTVETILAGEGKFLSVWPSDIPGALSYGVGQTVEASRQWRCDVMKL